MSIIIKKPVSRSKKGSHRIKVDSLSLPELIEVSEIVTARSKGILYEGKPKNHKVVKIIKSVPENDAAERTQFINQVNHTIVMKNKRKYPISAKAKAELKKIMEDEN